MDRAGAKIARGVPCPQCELELDLSDGRGSGQARGTVLDAAEKYLRSRVRA